MLGIQAPERRITRILRKIIAKAEDPKTLGKARWGLKRQEELLANAS